MLPQSVNKVTNMKKHVAVFSLLVVTFFTSSALAKCERVFQNGQGSDSSGGVPLIFGPITLQPTEFMPTGLIGSTTASVGQAGVFKEHGNQLLFTCDLADEGKTYENFATNGDSNVGGLNGNGEGVYQTFFPFIGIKIIRDKDGKVFSRYWQQSPISGHKEGNKLNFYARDFSSVTAEIYRFPATYRGGGNKFGCNDPAKDQASGISYTCTQPNGYTVFVGPGWNDDQDIKPGNDSAHYWGGFGYSNWIGFGMIYSPANTFRQSFWGCRVLNYTNPVTLPPVTVSDLKSGVKMGADFKVTYRCGGPNVEGAIHKDAGVGTGKISVAFRTNNPRPANAPGDAQWMPYLVSDNYGQNGYASNVGIAIPASGSDTPFEFITNEYTVDYTKGWFSLLAGEDSRTRNGYNQLDITSRYFASYAILNQADTITPGKVDATAYIVVRCW